MRLPKRCSDRKTINSLEEPIQTFEIGPVLARGEGAPARAIVKQFGFSVRPEATEGFESATKSAEPLAEAEAGLTGKGQPRVDPVSTGMGVNESE